MNTYPHRLSDRSEYAKLGFVPLGLLVLLALLRAGEQSAGPSVSLVTLDLLGLAVVALAGWLGGEFDAARGVPVERRRTRRLHPRTHFAHKTV